MKELLANSSVSVVLALVIICAIIATFAGCKTAPQETTAHIAVVYATSKYIEKAGDSPAQQARAKRVLDVVDQLGALASGDSATVDALADLARSKLPASLSPADRTLALTLITVATDELKARVGEGVGQIPPDAKVKVALVLSWVREGAESFAQPTS